MKLKAVCLLLLVVSCISGCGQNEEFINATQSVEPDIFVELEPRTYEFDSGNTSVEGVGNFEVSDIPDIEERSVEERETSEGVSDEDKTIEQSSVPESTESKDSVLDLVSQIRSQEVLSEKDTDIQEYDSLTELESACGSKILSFGSIRDSEARDRLIMGNVALISYTTETSEVTFISGSKEMEVLFDEQEAAETVINGVTVEYVIEDEGKYCGAWSDGDNMYQIVIDNTSQRGFVEAVTEALNNFK